MSFGINQKLGEAVCDLIERTSRDVPLSDLFVKLLCGGREPTAELLEWCEGRGLQVEQTGNQEFTFRKARPEDQKEEKIDSGCGEFVGSLFEL